MLTHYECFMAIAQGVMIAGVPTSILIIFVYARWRGNIERSKV
jgi:hypothetical protein